MKETKVNLIGIGAFVGDLFRLLVSTIHKSKIKEEEDPNRSFDFQLSGIKTVKIGTL
ncbi:hypothetical protein [Aquimarina megaterium]|uniref:hypothetical protein n=1 Tax=Aquimarina megaterium TaxID=1443666 RepID=UPI0004BBC824|nr:hypothetical protein [Aquimarina megaterium]